MNEKEIKQELLAKAGASPEQFFPTETLTKHGFSRHKCAKCNRFFWSHHAQEVCGDPACAGGFQFIGQKRKKQLGYIDVWKEFSKIHKKQGYDPISRYPVIARWNPTTDFTIASIAAFQPFVVSGQIPPPANPLVIPQMCLRFSDIDNVGITGHNVAFVMMGEHGFFPAKEYEPDKYLEDHLTWLKQGMGIEFKELTVHEDVWSGGGNLGPCMEFFSKGLEISNQVYMQYELTPSGLQDLNIKVLDMGQGMERAAWWTQGKASAYESTFPTIMKALRDKTGVEYDESFMQQFTPLAAHLNTDEVEDMRAAWKFVAKQLNMDVAQVQGKMVPLAGLYSIADHTRALLFAINDGGLPSNVGGMYNLRVILRRALGFIDKYGWDVSLPEVCKWHADYLQPLFPEVSEDLDDVSEILDIEKRKYESTKQKTKNMLPRLMEKDLSEKELVELYDSQGIAPELLKEEAEKQGKEVKVPDNFYAQVAARHEQKEQEHATLREQKVPIGKIPETKILYFDDYVKSTFDAKVLEIVDGKFVILDQTAFYPASGGQIADRGTIEGDKVVDIFKQGPYVVHELEEKAKFHAGDVVHGEIDFGRRTQLAQHHTATHIINAAAKGVLGGHIFQAGAKKDLDKAHIDVTHYELPTDEQLAEIEAKANRIVEEGHELRLCFMPREEAEAQFGMAIYQGGVAPGRQLRIVDIPGIDVEACGGTHVKSTSEVGTIKILKATKVKDGVVRLVFTAGSAAKHAQKEEHDVLNKAAALLGGKVSQVPARAGELFGLWKKARKAKKKSQPLPDTALSATKEEEGDLLAKTAEALQTQPEHIIKTLERFKKEIEEWSKGQ